MKKGKYHIVYSWILLICFVAGQYMVYSHTHNIIGATAKINASSKNIPQQTLTEKCSLCDVMLHNAMDKAAQVYISPVTVCGHVYKSFEYNFTSIQLILSGGRAPPATNYIG